MKKIIKDRIFENSMLSSTLLNDDVFCKSIESIAKSTIKTLSKNKTVFFAGNGGSASQAQHIAAELSGRFLLDRDPLNAVNLSDNISFLTAVSNDYSFDKIYERALFAHGRKGDMIFLLSTSGASQNVINAQLAAKQLGIKTVALTGLKGIKFAASCDKNITIPSLDTARIQEMHILCGHIICEIVENEIFGKS